MSSKDIQLDIVQNLDLLKQQGTDYLLITMEPGKNADRADVWHELKNEDSPGNLLHACLSLFAEIYDGEDLIPILLDYCEKLGDAYGEEKVIKLPPIKKKKSKNK